MISWFFVGLVVTVLMTPGPTNTLLASSGIQVGVRRSLALIPTEALGYFISPIDLIPDLLPLGYSDDLALIVFVITKMKNSFTPEIRKMAEDRLRKYFDNIDESSFKI